MDWLPIASAAVGILIPFFKKAGNKAAEKAGEALFDAVQDKVEGDEEAESALENFQKKPDRYSTALADILREKAESDPEFGENLKQLVRNADGEALRTMTQVAKGKGIAQAAGNDASASVSISGSETS